MRRVELLLIAASIVLVSLMIWHWQRWLPGQTPQATLAPNLPVDPAVSKKAKTANSSRSKNVDRNSAAFRAKDLAGVTFPTDPLPTTTVVRPLLDVPDSKKMEIGTTRSDLQKRYGAPTVAVSSVRDGRLVELYYYVKPDRANMVVATLREGKLVSAQNTTFWQPQQKIGVESAQ